jgi:hypothetical protein
MSHEKDQDATEFALNIRRPYKKMLEEAIAKDKIQGTKNSISSYQADEDTPITVLTIKTPTPES